MLPQVMSDSSIKPLYARFIKALKDKKVAVDVDSRMATRLCLSTDNSVYQVIPQAVLFPRSHQGVVELMQLASTEPYKNIKMTARGGGTACNGQSLNDGILVDLSRYLNHIGTLDLENQQVTVEPGVVLDQLNDFLKPHGYFFAPQVAPSSRATIGGMFATDACGKGSRIYGKTANHVLCAQVVLASGEVLSCRKRPYPTQDDELEGHPIEQQVAKWLIEHRQEIKKRFPKLTRYLTGYNLAHVVDHQQQTMNLIPLLAGSEGTLALTTQLTLKILPIPKHRSLVAIFYNDFYHGLNDAKRLLEKDPLAIETLDANLLHLAKKDPIYAEVKSMLPTDDQSLQAMNLVEWVGDNPQDVLSQAHGLLNRADDSSQGVVHVYVAKNEQEMTSLWSLRKRAVGLLANLPGPKQPVPFIEDTVVPPSHLADYIRDFRAVLDAKGLTYGMFGHVDVGCLHVRPALNMQDPKDRALVPIISHQINQLVKRYKGLVWAEHGKGFRSEFLPDYMGPTLYDLMGQIKSLFDPCNRLNTGKLVSTDQEQYPLVKNDSSFRGERDQQLSPEVRLSHRQVLACNGNAACMDYNPDHLMCPSYHVTGDRVHSPKGRASLMREWLIQLAKVGYDVNRLPSKRFKWKKYRSNDFSDEVYQAMRGCLGCKACSGLCPVKVNVPQLKSQFLAHYHSRVRRSIRDYVVGYSDQISWALARLPRGLSWFFTRPLFQRFVGLVDMPRLAPRLTIKRLLKHSENLELNTADVILIPDLFTVCYQPQVLEDALMLFRKLGIKAGLHRPQNIGKNLYHLGFMEAFKRQAKINTHALMDYQKAKIPLVGLDPSLTMTYQDEYAKVLGDTHQLEVQVLDQWLAKYLQSSELTVRRPRQGHYLLFNHCSQKALDSEVSARWLDIFKFFGVSVQNVTTGCCGMAGSYGHEAEHQLTSQQLFEMNWAQVIKDNPHATLMATGFSCRSQAKRYTGMALSHPASILAAIVNDKD